MHMAGVATAVTNWRRTGPIKSLHLKKFKASAIRSWQEISLLNTATNFKLEDFEVDAKCLSLVRFHGKSFFELFLDDFGVESLSKGLKPLESFVI